MCGVTQDVHEDAIFSGRLRTKLEATLRTREGWNNGTCDWDAQLSVLVGLAMPPGGGALQYFVRDRGAWVSRRLEHAVGKAILLECRRPHSLLPHAADDAGSTAPRIVLHGFLVPCWATSGSDELEYQLLGPIGGTSSAAL